LFLASNPEDKVRLRLDKEFNTIENKIQGAKYRDFFELKQRNAVRIDELQEILLKYNPNIVHFSGHGSLGGNLIFEDINGNAQKASQNILSDLFSFDKKNMKCVFLNACFAADQADTIANYIDSVIGMSNKISDVTASTFAASFYLALAYGRSIGESYRRACLQLETENIHILEKPMLLSKNNIDLNKEFLLDPNIIHLEKLQNSFERLSKTNKRISFREFWEEENKGNLHKILTSYLENSEQYDLSDENKSLIENLIATVNAKIIDLNFSQEFQKDKVPQLRIDIMKLFMKSMQIIQELSNARTENINYSI